MTQNQDDYFFQIKKATTAKKFFKKGSGAGSAILLELRDLSQNFLDNVPKNYFVLLRQALESTYKMPKGGINPATLRVNLHRLIKQGLVEQDPKKKFYFLTEEGKQMTSYIKDRFEILKGHWDEKFRVVLFDIPEEKKHWREWLRKELNIMQFVQLQKSAYIGKYPLAQSFYEQLIKAGLKKHIFILTIGEIDRKDDILEMFEE